MGRNKVIKLNQDRPSTWQEAMEQFIWWKEAGGLSKASILEPIIRITYKN